MSRIYLTIMTFVIVTLFSFTTLLPAKVNASIFDTSMSSLFQQDDSFLPVHEAFEFDFDQQDNQIKVKFTIAEGYYLYRHQFKFSAGNATIADVILPNGTEHEDDYFGVQQVFYDELVFDIDILSSSNTDKLTITYQGCATKGLCYPPTKQTLTLSDYQSSTNSADIVNAITGAESNQTPTANNQTNTAEVSEQNQLAALFTSNSSLAWILLVFFGGGLLLSFTPCVFPMYPILAGIIVGQGDKLSNKRAFLMSFAYVQGMAITYTILGVVVALAGAQFQAMFQHPAVLIVLSILFIFLALAMFGVFNLALPSGLQNKLNNLSNKQQGGAIGSVFLMGAISGLVASPCTTAPLTGALLYIAQSGDIIIGASALYALSLGMGIPLLVLGSSGGKLLPKAGAWMSVIKNIFGFLLLAVPIFLLERFIPEIASTLLWSVLILATFTYFYVVNNTSANKSSFAYGARALVIFIGIFVGANIGWNAVMPSSNAIKEDVHGKFVMVKDLAELNATVAKANRDGKTVMVDLYADWCIACKEFEQFTFPDTRVQQALANSVMVQIDLTNTGSDSSVELMQHFDIFGLPSILFFDLQGNELKDQRVTGFMNAEKFSAHINRIFNN